MLQVFDAPNGDSACVRRARSNTPLQALTLLNDAAFLEAAQAIGRQLAAGKGPPDLKARELWRRCLIRPPTADEEKLVVGFYTAQRKRLSEKAGDLIELTGDAELLDRAAWTAAARAVLNLDEMVTRE